MNISIEITPRDEATVHHEVEQIKQHLPQVNTINIPDITRMPVRSWDACRMVKPHYAHAIPHIRAIDFDLEGIKTLERTLQESDLTSVLVVTGDASKTNMRPVYPTNSVALIRKLKQQHPDWHLYAAIDPYRQNLQDEYRYCMEKLEAGATGFFTQPFFDLRLMSIYADLFTDVPIFWGASPVLTDKSRAYWETVNRVVFPKDFRTSLAWNRWFASAALDVARANNGNIYYMPIRADVVTYLEGIV